MVYQVNLSPDGGSNRATFFATTQGTLFQTNQQIKVTGVALRSTSPNGQNALISFWRVSDKSLLARVWLVPKETVEIVPISVTLEPNVEYVVSGFGVELVCATSIGTSAFTKTGPDGTVFNVKGRVSSNGNAYPETHEINRSFMAFYIDYRLNDAPSVTLSSPANNETLTEGKGYSISGSATDIDVGDVVTIKYKINNGTARVLRAADSDGSTSINFSKNLTYRNKRLWDGSTDVVGYDLAQNTNHTLTVWAEDDKGGKSPDITRTFTVIWNRPPVISGQDKNLGTISSPPSESFSVTDPDGNPFTIEYYLDNQKFNSFSGVSGQTYTVTIAQNNWLRTSLKQHQLKIRAIDNQGAYSERIFTFTRTDDRIEFTLNYSNASVKSFFTTNQKANRILVTMDAVIPTGAQLLVRACNNAYDAQPTWEDITGPVQAKRGYQFTNTTSTSGKWGINIHIRILKGTATDTVILNGFGGAFD
ncbi:Ig-like domain-containing protein [Brevibacillus borstelensis]|uniref:Ig-like domain-containing protein n=1 Tax=Brevibacillus borstelensis TaxID=45462 RepID=UPI00287F3F36|nr:Ig-like domain-containing protein [Brevibacillus borstelensis]WNF07281.1 Ig-like domain-containing protein [Brevibacillus borstelensis]